VGMVAGGAAFWKADCHDAWGGWQGEQHTAAGLNRSQHHNGALGRSASACPSRPKAEREMQRPSTPSSSGAQPRNPSCQSCQSCQRCLAGGGVVACSADLMRRRR
jgi:hypothetical protein